MANTTKESIMVLDVETTGLPPRPSRYKRFPDPQKCYTDYDNARLVELAYKVFDENGTLVRAVSVLIKSNSFVITNAHIHGITQEMTQQFGQPIEVALTSFLCAVFMVDVIVCHNVEFDINIILAELWRSAKEHDVFNFLDIEDVISKKKVCTMKWGQDKLQLEQYPKLVYLYNTLCVKGTKQSSWSQNHRALDDVDKCAQCFFALKENATSQT